MKNLGLPDDDEKYDFTQLVSMGEHSPWHSLHGGRVLVRMNHGVLEVATPLVSALEAEVENLKLFKRSVLDPENQPSQYGTTLLPK